MATEKQVPTQWGFFGFERIVSLRKTLADAKAAGMNRDEVTTFEGNELLIAFGEYLLEYVDGEYSRRNNGGL